MASPSGHRRSSKRKRLAVAAAILAILALAGILALERSFFGPRPTSAGQANWLLWVLAIPAYFLLQFLAEAVLEAYWGANSTAAKAVPVVILLLFYATYFALA
jgi:cation transport ATPase